MNEPIIYETLLQIRSIPSILRDGPFNHPPPPPVKDDPTVQTIPIPPSSTQTGSDTPFRRKIKSSHTNNSISNAGGVQIQTLSQPPTQPSIPPRPEIPEEQLVRIYTKYTYNQVVWKFIKQNSNWKPTGDFQKADVVWLSDQLSNQEIEPFLQASCTRTNRFLGMRDAVSKHMMTKFINRMKLFFAEQYEFYPVSYNLPDDILRIREVISSDERERANFEAAAAAVAPPVSTFNNVAANPSSAIVPDVLKEDAPQASMMQTEQPMIEAPSSVSNSMDVDSTPIKSDLSQIPAAPIPPNDPTQITPPPKKTYIVKPSYGCGGAGIYLTQDLKEVLKEYDQSCKRRPYCEPAKYTIQEYIEDQLLIEDFKFDFRVYALLTSLQQVEVYLFDDGIARFCTEKYNNPTEENMNRIFMHLTNYAINKDNSQGFTISVLDKDWLEEENSSQRSIKSVFSYLASVGHDTEKIWSDIGQAILRTIYAMRPFLLIHYHMAVSDADEHIRNQCFQVLGFDFVLDKRLKPWLVEVNNNPSLKMYSKIDERIKTILIDQTMHLISFDLKKQQKLVAQELQEKENFVLDYSRMNTKRKLSKPATIVETKKQQQELTLEEFLKQFCPQYRNLKLQTDSSFNDAILAIFSSSDIVNAFTKRSCTMSFSKFIMYMRRFFLRPSEENGRKRKRMQKLNKLEIEIALSRKNSQKNHIPDYEKFIELVSEIYVEKQMALNINEINTAVTAETETDLKKEQR